MAGLGHGAPAADRRKRARSSLAASIRSGPAARTADSGVWTSFNYSALRDRHSATKTGGYFMDIGRTLFVEPHVSYRYDTDFFMRDKIVVGYRQVQHANDHDGHAIGAGLDLYIADNMSGGLDLQTDARPAEAGIVQRNGLVPHPVLTDLARALTRIALGSKVWSRRSLPKDLPSRCLGPDV